MVQVVDGGSPAGVDALTTLACQPWASLVDVCAPCNEMDSTLLEQSLAWASDILYDLTGRQWGGECPDTVWPGTDSCAAPGYLPRSRRRGVKLPGYPVVGVDSVTIDGVEVNPARYRVEDRRWLVYLPAAGETRGGWPSGQASGVVDGQPGTWSVTYRFGLAPPVGGRLAAAALGCQLALSCSPDSEGECRLPQRVTSITRQGISLAVLDPLTLFVDGLTGLPEVDLWVQSVRLGRARRSASLMVPGRRAVARHGTDPYGSLDGGYPSQPPTGYDGGTPEGVDGGAP